MKFGTTLRFASGNLLSHYVSSRYASRPLRGFDQA